MSFYDYEGKPLAGGGGGEVVASVEPAESDIPKVFFGGALQQTKDEAVVPFRYISKTEDISGYAEIKAQGSSSMDYAKKNQTVKLFKDADCTEKLKVDFKGWGKQNKYVFKANWIDLTHARNIVCARLWGDIVKSRANYAELPEELRTSPNQGAVDGFPVKVYADGVYQGRYTINIPKDKWMANMDDELDTHCILCGESNADDRSLFRATASINGSDWSDEIHDTVPTAIKTRWNEVISFVLNSSSAEFKGSLGNYFDIPSLIDYHLFNLADCGFDAYGKNQLYFTYDGALWIANVYDLDATWGLWWNGQAFVATDYDRSEYQDFKDGNGNLLYIRLEQLFPEELKTRWAELKTGALTIENIINRFERFTDIAPTELVKEDYASTTGGGKFTGIPSQATNNIQQIRAFALARLAWTDEYVNGLTGEQPDSPEPTDVPCTGITLSASALTFTAEGTQTLTATVTPNGCTDTVTWETTASSVATVSGGVVTAVGNGNATITAKCGAYSAICSVSVSGVGEVNDGVDYTLDALSGLTWVDGYKYNSTTGEYTASANEHCTPKFEAQDCIYQLNNTGGNSYVALYAWDADDNYLFCNENNFYQIQLKPGYKYAIKAYNSGTFDGSTITLVPVDNRDTMGEKVTINFADITESEITLKALSNGRYRYEFDLTNRMAGYITSAGAKATLHNVNRLDKMLCVGQGDNNTDPIIGNAETAIRITGWQTKPIMHVYSKTITTVADMAAYAQSGKLNIVLNDDPVT